MILCKACNDDCHMLQVGECLKVSICAWYMVHIFQMIIVTDTFIKISKESIFSCCVFMCCSFHTEMFSVQHF